MGIVVYALVCLFRLLFRFCFGFDCVVFLTVGCLIVLVVFVACVFVVNSVFVCGYFAGLCVNCLVGYCEGAYCCSVCDLLCLYGSVVLGVNY